MAPLKRSSTITQRETRTTRAAAVAKKKAADYNKSTSSIEGTKPKPAKTTSTRRNQGTSDQALSNAVSNEEHIRDDVDTTRTRATRSTQATLGAAAVPRRRLKITPLDAPISEKMTEKKEKPSTKETSSRSKTTRSKTVKLESLETGPSVTTSVSSLSRKSKASEKRSQSNASAVKSQDQTNHHDSGASKPTTEQMAQPVITTRATRSRRTQSVSSTVPHDRDPKVAKPVNATRKKVTFQDVLDENEKENQPLPPSKGKKLISKKDVDTQTPANGLRAKPVRKATTATSRTRRSTQQEDDASKAAAKSTENMPRALTPKKITQIAKSSSVERGDSSDEDELNGGKTPVRDLSVSPRRPATVALARALSPSKKLDFNQNLVPISPEKTAVFRDNAEQNGMMNSPARRPARSPFKDSIKLSAKRGINDAAKLLFPAQIETSTSLASQTANNDTKSMVTMLQSPKRPAALDSSLFSQSVLKKSVTKSPFKASLFTSPAKRLFSPAKKASNPPESNAAKSIADDQLNNDVEYEVSASSHFRSSLSPLRVTRVDAIAGELNFDDSIMDVRSPLKALKSPPKMASTPAHNNIRITVPLESSTISEVASIEPKVLTSSQVPPSDIASNTNNQDEEVQVESGPAMEGSAENTSTEGSSQTSRSKAAQGPVASQNLFRSSHSSSDDSSSEDELAGDKTPVPQRKAQLNSSVKVVTQAESFISQSSPKTDVAFTPLTNQISGWLASSPAKSSVRKQDSNLRRQSTEFSPLAREHVDGEIIISRDSTPLQKLGGRISMLPPSSKLNRSVKHPTSLRKSLIQRQSVGLSSTESPVRNPQFEEYMEIRALEEQANSSSTPRASTADLHHNDLDQLFTNVEQLEADDEGDDTVLDRDIIDGSDEPGDLTTDLINFTHASDTAVVDFLKLAQEADDLAAGQDGSYITENVSPNVNEDEADNDTSACRISNMSAGETDEVNHSAVVSSLVDSSSSICPAAQPPLLQPVDHFQDSPSVLVIGEDGPSSPAPSSPEAARLPSPTLSIQTPKREFPINERRIVNTVVSKVPLKPEGLISPIKVARKRARSFGTSDASPAKHISLDSFRALSSTNSDDEFESPNRCIRTSAAPSPGGTSTPFSSRSNQSRASRMSMNNEHISATPGRMSFAVDDFGDSTLDGIELPDDFEGATELIAEDDSLSTVETPRSFLPRTPATAKQNTPRATTPATVNKRTPRVVEPKSTVLIIDQSRAERTPLKPVGHGILHGITAFVDVHTSEGADASGIFVELLSQMGAKCVRDWRWNPRGSGNIAGEGDAEQKIGITHVVYKDGGKRILEKVREAKGQVCCVGVAWVLDCERDNKWLDESSYSIDLSMLPRGGSNRRKSMEPRALLIANDGSISASRARRSVSAELNQLMKQDLLNTPVRQQTRSPSEVEEEEDVDDDQATPTGFVSYDPHIAMTPATPYLVSQGKKIVQMSAPPKQQNRSLFDDENQENDETLMEGENGNAAVVKDARKFRMKNLNHVAKRRQTLGWKPVVGSPLGRK